MNLHRGIIPGLVLSVALAACSATSSTTTQGVASLSDAATSDQSATANEAPVNTEDAIKKYNACVAAEGMPEIAIPEDLATGAGGLTPVSGQDVEGSPGNTFDANTFDFDRFQEVKEKCGAFLDSAFGDFTLSPEEEAVMRDAELAFTRCMKDQGFDIDVLGSGSDAPSIDPDEPGSDGSTSKMEVAEEDVEKFNEAVNACKHVFEDAQKQLDAAASDR